MPDAADIKKNKVSVFAPIAIALLGYRKGSTTRLEMAGGIQEFEILKVTRIGLRRDGEEPEFPAVNAEDDYASGHGLAVQGLY